MNANVSSSSAPPPLLPPRSLPSSLSPTLQSSSHSAASPSISSPRTHSPETQRQIAEARAALEASMSNIGSSLDRTLRSRAQNLHDNSKQLEKQQKDVIKATEGLKKESEKLGKVAVEGMKRVKELGNVQNWAEMLERDFLVLGETLRLAEYGSSGSQSGSSWETGSDASVDRRREEALPGFEGEWKFEAEDDVQMEEQDGFESPFISDLPQTVEAPERLWVDDEGDTCMDGAEGGSNDKGKGKAVEASLDAAMDSEYHAPISGRSLTAANIARSASDPCFNSGNTAASVIS
ncbi:hypothetical protein QTJ16_003578 [Diplocarpon rosae]|uniref:Biogenesis of lysosome-related organelles complex 1 subunit 1 n=1 Tax=Diplocarpon rosae TaxID=946125 RepID=A0AAD9T1Y5_9HELO|nr:hypothetical protein QTJ16_003578 [Diplocarpon rosae]PBP23690.1 hypothetical protein BUE80_DR005408 [Diplocarpon rosae]